MKRLVPAKGRDGPQTARGADTVKIMRTMPDLVFCWVAGVGFEPT
jgi:hypothetical protein